MCVVLRCLIELRLDFLEVRDEKYIKYIYMDLMFLGIMSVFCGLATIIKVIVIIVVLVEICQKRVEIEIRFNSNPYKYMM